MHAPRRHGTLVPHDAEETLMPSPTRGRGRRTVAAAVLALSAALLTGCGATDEVPDVDLDRLGEQIEQGIDGARDSLEGV